MSDEKTNGPGARKGRRRGAGKPQQGRLPKAAGQGGAEEAASLSALEAALDGVERLGSPAHALLSAKAHAVAESAEDAFEYHDAPALIATRVSACNKPPIQYRRMPDGSWLECYLQPDCTYAGCQPVDPRFVPPSIRT